VLTEENDSSCAVCVGPLSQMTGALLIWEVPERDETMCRIVIGQGCQNHIDYRRRSILQKTQDEIGDREILVSEWIEAPSIEAVGQRLMAKKEAIFRTDEAKWTRLHIMDGS